MMEYKGKIVEIMGMSYCPNKCKHCFINYTGNISFPKLKKMLQNYVPKYNEVILNGTELLQDEKYLKLCKEFKQDFIYTNGRLLTPQNISLLKEYGIKRISVSLHVGIQDEISLSSEKEISEAIKNAVAAGISVRVLCTISKYNYRHIEKIADYVYSLGACGIKFINMMREGKATNFTADTFLSKSDIALFLQQLQQVRAKYDEKSFYVTRSGTFGPDKERNSNFSCIAGKELVVLTPNGDVYPCEFLMAPQYKIGYWDEKGIYLDKPIENDTKNCLALENNFFDIGKEK